MNMRTMSRSKTIGMAALATALGLALGGCAMPNSSNPTLSIARTQVANNQAMLDMVIENPSDMDVHISDIDWSLVYGPLPVADGSWTLGVPIPSKGSYQFSKRVRFSSPALDPTANEIELSGTLQMATEGNSGNTALNGAGFVAKKQIQK